MSRSYLIVDIETVADPALPWDAAKGGFPPAPFHQVAALGVLWLDGEYHLKKIGAFGGDQAGASDERTMLEEFARFMGREHPNLVTFNGRRFDLPVLANRMLKHGVPFSTYYADRDYRYRYSDAGHIDLADLLTDYGAGRMPSLDALAQLVGMPGKMGVDGSQVQGMYDEGRHVEIRDYCLHDVVQTAFVFLRVELLRGRMDRQAYRARAQALWTELEKDARVQAVLQEANRPLALLED